MPDGVDSMISGLQYGVGGAAVGGGAGLVASFTAGGGNFDVGAGAGGGGLVGYFVGSGGLGVVLLVGIAAAILIAALVVYSNGPEMQE